MHGYVLVLTMALLCVTGGAEAQLEHVEKGRSASADIAKSVPLRGFADDVELVHSLYSLGLENGDALIVIVAARIAAARLKPPPDRHAANQQSEGEASGFMGVLPSLAEMQAEARRLAGSDPVLRLLIDQIPLTGKRSMIGRSARFDLV